MPHLDNDDPRCARRVLRSGGFLCRGSEALPVLDRQAALALPSGRKPFLQKSTTFLTKTTPQAIACGVSAQLVQKPRRVSPPQRRKKVSIIFSGDMRGGENTSQAASVEFVCRRRTNYARSRLQPLCQKGILFDSDNPAGDCLRGCLSMTLQAQRSAFLSWDAGELRLRQITPTARPSSRRRAS